MNASKSIARIVSISAIAIVTATAPAIAIPNNSDTSGTYTNGQTDILYGFEALSNKPVIDAILKEVLNATNKLVSNGQTQAVRTVGKEAASAIQSFTERVGNDPNSAPISAETREALTNLSKYLEGVEKGLWAYGNDLDTAVEASAQGLLKDLNAANKGCQANPSSCAQFNNLVANTSNFVQKLKAFETMLHNEVQKARIY